MTAPATKSLEAKCSCGSIHLTFDVPTSFLPLPTYLCHCSICRYSTGAPCVFHAVLPKGITPNFIAPSTGEGLTTYKPAQDCTYDFCSTCGCHVAGVSFGRDDWTIATSMFLDHSPANFKIVSHVFSKSGPNGAIPATVSHIGGRELSYYNPPDDDPRAKVTAPSAEVGPDGEDRLRAQCHCGGVSFTLGRPTQSVLDDEFMSKFVSAADKTKWVAVYDICNDCRLVNGTHVAGWTFVPRSLCEPPIEKDLKIGTAKTYSSSEGVLRSFCGTCGATVFFSCEARQPTDGQAVVDIATGILRCPEGVMGESWFIWRGRVAHEGSGIEYDGEFGEALRQGMRAWCLEKYGEVTTMEIE
ncbi:hypothetical protein QQS21_007493 [Conoideocrella luteorostrata]|uniref:CENP-V/GFA domain-containing protein n=1 Tax=Conoideocrella luteorostrata TaxID=1105319 RepID=A0AAJ0CL06_9HYPO|nr:hypothetical protein QQS21_007493 [Conoideocrella luteorostrata]